MSLTLVWTVVNHTHIVERETERHSAAVVDSNQKKANTAPPTLLSVALMITYCSLVVAAYLFVIAINLRWADSSFAHSFYTRKTQSSSHPSLLT